jgi:hypothetical protein
MVATVAEPEVAPAPPAPARGFERWGLAAYLAATSLLLVAILVRLGGTLVYALDDAAIHMSVADTLIHHGTWGVDAGVFQSASSSPLWTLLVAAGMAVAPLGDQWVPLLLNLAAGAAVVIVLGRNQSVLRPSRRRPLDAAVVVVLVTVVLFLPGLAVTGMEHTLHIALTLGAVALFQRRAEDAADRGGLPAWAPYALLGLATLTRFETAFVGAGLMAGLAYDWARTDAGPGARVALRRQIVGVAAAVAVPLTAFSLVNVALGGGVLPNPVLAKGQGVGSGARASAGLSPQDIGTRLGADPLLAALAVFAVAYVVLTWGRPARYRLTAVTLAVATLGHCALADVGWFERYQAYLIALGVYLVLGVIAEAPAGLRTRALTALLVVAVVLTPTKATLLVRSPQWADEMYEHTYQAGVFLHRYYQGRPVATDQLGYITLFHDGPVTDFAGLGDYEVLRHSPPRSQLPVYWAELQAERGFPVAVLPQITSAFATPPTWILGGTLRIDGHYEGVSRRLEFWATSPAEVRPLQRHLEEYEPELPRGVTLEMNGFAEMQADAVESRGGAAS